MIRCVGCGCVLQIVYQSNLNGATDDDTLCEDCKRHEQEVIDWEGTDTINAMLIRYEERINDRSNRRDT